MTVGYNVPPWEMVNEKSQNHKGWAGYSKESNVEAQRKPQRDPGHVKLHRDRREEGTLYRMQPKGPVERHGEALITCQLTVLASCKSNHSSSETIISFSTAGQRLRGSPFRYSFRGKQLGAILRKNLLLKLRHPRDLITNKSGDKSTWTVLTSVFSVSSPSPRGKQPRLDVGHCGVCRLAALGAWENLPGSQAEKLIVTSRGSSDARKEATEVKTALIQDLHLLNLRKTGVSELSGRPFLTPVRSCSNTSSLSFAIFLH